jgi:hypothetical protein
LEGLGHGCKFDLKRLHKQLYSTQLILCKKHTS